jgi:hypothetical protein
VTDICRRVVPAMQTWPSGRQVACHLATAPQATAVSGQGTPSVSARATADPTGERIADP